jgi:adenine phosphoribosyltransferase
MDLTYLKGLIRDVPDFPKPGILFKDITPILEDADAYRYVTDTMISFVESKSFTKIAAIEARGFVLGAPLAYALDKGFVMLRKKGKLPYKKFQECYELEYGIDCLEMHQDSVNENDVVYIVDDVLATGGTALHAARLVERGGAKVAGFIFLIELTFLHGRDKLKDYEVYSIIQF